MNKYIASSGVILLLLAAFFFFANFNGGMVGSLSVTGGYPIASFASFVFVILFLPIGAGLAFAGFAYRGPRTYATTTPGSTVAVVPAGSSGVAKAALAVAIIAILVSAGTLAAVIAVSGQVGTLSSSSGKGGSGGSTTTSSAAVAGGQFNQTPSVIAYKVDWCNTDNTGQDRYCPNQLTVIQGDIVQIMFIHNDTDAHTFTLQTPPYSFQINASSAGMHNFISNGFNTGSCSNNGTFSAISAAISGTYCVSGTSVMSGSALNSTGAGTFRVAQNPTPAVPLQNSTLQILPIDNQVHFVNTTAAAINASTIEIWGIGAFQATQPGIYEFFCHYHVSNGMFGYIIVLPNAYCTSSPSACGESNSTSTT